MTIYKRFGLFAIACFLGVQILSFLHIAEYGADKHEHKGHVCAVYLHYEHTAYSTPVKGPAVQAPVYMAAAFAVSVPSQIDVKTPDTSLPRAPPQLS